jgi:hypothetical protein
MTAARKTTSLMIAGGMTMAIGGQLHPKGEGDTFDDSVLSMLQNSAWNLSHLLLLVGLLLGVAALVVAKRGGVFAPSVGPWLTAAIVGWSLGAIEMIPHALSATESDAFQAGGSTPLLDLHTWIEVISTPALGLSSIALAIAVARDARTRPAWILAAIATLGGLAFAAAGPVINLTENSDFAALFAGQAAISIWLIGTALRLRGDTAARPARSNDIAKHLAGFGSGMIWM